jgi:hypothetical protein
MGKIINLENGPKTVVHPGAQEHVNELTEKAKEIKEAYVDASERYHNAGRQINLIDIEVRGAKERGENIDVESKMKRREHLQIEADRIFYEELEPAIIQYSEIGRGLKEKYDISIEPLKS